MTQEQAITLANEKRDIAEKLVLLRSEAANINKSVKTLRAALMGDIAGEINGDGKAKFSNAEKREAELDVRLAGSPQYCENTKRLDEIAKNTTRLDIDHEFASDMLKIAVAFAVPATVLPSVLSTDTDDKLF